MQRPSQLATAAARASANGTSAVMFSVRMSRGLGLILPGDNEHTDEPPQSAQTLAADSAAVPEAVLATVMAREELLYFSSGDIEFHVTTRGTSDRRVTDLPVEAAVASADPQSKLVRLNGRTTLNPGFLYEAAHQLEVMLVFGAQPWAPTVTESLVTTRLAKDLAALVFEQAKAPILFMHLPAAPYREPTGHERGDGSLEALRHTHALCLRMSLALVGEQTGARLRFLEELGRKANDWGVGLLIGDLRPGKIRGEWITVRQFDADRFRVKAEEELTHVTGEVVTRGQPVTIVGPARVGSSLAVFKALAQHNVGLVGLSVTAMQEVAFINFIALPSAGAGDCPVGAFPLRVGLDHLIRVCGIDVDPATETFDLGDTRAAADYYVLTGRPGPVTVDDKHSARSRPLWLTWDIPFGRVDLDDVLVYLTKSLKAQNVSHVLQYGRARLASDGGIRGRAKVSVQLTREQSRAGGARERLRQLSAYLEDSIRGEVARRAHLHDSEVRIRVMWRERWLGSWDTPL